MSYCVVIKNNEISINLKNQIMSLIEKKYDDINPEYIICIGGDGTILRAVQRYQHLIDKVIIFGIHTGNLGYYSNYKISDWKDVINSVNNDEYQTEQRHVLSYVAKGTINLSGIALNEITVMSAHKTLFLDVNVDDEKLSTYRATGICICTSSGSTAYNKSLNGAILDPSIKSLQLTEIAPINSNAYKALGTSIILNENSVITLENITADVCLTADNTYYESMTFEEIKVMSSNLTVKMAVIKPRSFVQRIKDAFLSE